MNREKSILQFSKNNCLRFSALFLAAIFCLYQTTTAQSGRKKDKPPEKTEQIVKSETVKEPQDDKQTEPVSAIKITGEIQYESGWHQSSYLGSALDEAVENLTGRPSRPLEVSKGKKMKLNDAKEFAKKEAKAHVLWIGFFVKSYLIGYENIEYVAYVDYALLKPTSGTVLMFGRIELGKANMGNTGTVLKIPTNGRRLTQLAQLKQGAREVAILIKRGGWLD